MGWEVREGGRGQEEGEGGCGEGGSFSEERGEEEEDFE